MEYIQSQLYCVVMYIKSISLSILFFSIKHTKNSRIQICFNPPKNQTFPMNKCTQQCLFCYKNDFIMTYSSVFLHISPGLFK